MSDLRPTQADPTPTSPGAPNRANPPGRRPLLGVAAVITLGLVAALGVALWSPEATPPGTAAPGLLRTDEAGRLVVEQQRAAGDRALLFGGSAADRAALRRQEEELGRPLAGVRMFRRWGEPLIDDDVRWVAESGRQVFLSVKSRRADGAPVPFRDVAAAAPGSPLYAEMAAQAEQVADLGLGVQLTYNHEPDADPDLGTGAEFAAAWRTWVRVFRDHGATNARFVWTTTGFGHERQDHRSAHWYWPGDEWVDLIGVDVYNFYRCLGPRGAWKPLDRQLGPTMAFARQHPDKGVVLMEWSSAEDRGEPGRKAAWIREAAELLLQPEYQQIVALLQWSGRHRTDNARSCDFDLASSRESLAAIRQMGADPRFQGHQLPESVLD